MRASSIAALFDRLWPLFHKNPLDVFPAEIMSLILQHLEPQDLLTVSLASKSWRERLTDGNLWKEKFGIEGWTLDVEQIERYEKEHKSASLHNAESEFKRSELGVLGRSKNRLVTEGESSNAGFSKDADHEMSDADTIRSPDPAHTAIGHQGVSESRSSSRGKGKDPVLRGALHAPLPKQPLMILTARESRINYQFLYKQKRRLEENWDKGRYRNFQLPHRDFPEDAHQECVYTIQYQGNYLVSGSRDRTLRVWDLETGRLAKKPLCGHSGSVLCLQFDSRPEEDIIISGSSDTNVILWRFSTGERIKKIDKAHQESVLNLRFDHRFLVTCSKDKTIKIWNRQYLRPGYRDYPVKGLPNGGECPAYIIDAPSIGNSVQYQPTAPEHLTLLEPYMHLMTLDLHGAAVNAIQIYNDELVSASGDRDLRMWNIHTGVCHSKIKAHEKGIACVQYDGKRIVSGSSDNSIRIWCPFAKSEVARLEGHTRLVRTLQAGFADAPGGRERLEAEAAAVDRQWEIARANGEDIRPNRPGRPARPGSRRPRDLKTRGAKIPPSGGGSKWARIISGSYDEKVIIWKKNVDDEWVVSHQLAQEEALTAAGPPLLSRVNPNQPRPAPTRGTPNPYGAVGDPPPSETDPSAGGPSASPTPNPAQQLLELLHTPPPPGPSTTTNTQTLPPTPLPHSVADAPSSSTAPPAAIQPALHAANNRPPPLPAHVYNAQNRPPNPRPVLTVNAAAAPGGGGQPNARVFKLQFDSRRIICCSQDNKIVGWDFANGDEDIMSCSKFFAQTE